MIEPILGFLMLLAFVAKIIIQILLDGVSEKSNDDYFRARYLLPYDREVPDNYVSLKKICNISYYLLICLLFLFLLVRIIQ